MDQDGPWTQTVQEINPPDLWNRDRPAPKDSVSLGPGVPKEDMTWRRAKRLPVCQGDGTLRG